jgi:hypothetical protein
MSLVKELQTLRDGMIMEEYVEDVSSGVTGLVCLGFSVYDLIQEVRLQRGMYGYTFLDFTLVLICIKKDVWFCIFGFYFGIDLLAT